MPVANVMLGQLPNTSQDNVLTNSLYSFPTISSFSSWVAAQSLTEWNEPSREGHRDRSSANEAEASENHVDEIHTSLEEYCLASV